MKEQSPSIYCLQETYFKYKDTHRLKVKGQRKVHPAFDKQKKARQSKFQSTENYPAETEILFNKRVNCPRRNSNL